MFQLNFANSGKSATLKSKATGKTPGKPAKSSFFPNENVVLIPELATEKGKNSKFILSKTLCNTLGLALTGDEFLTIIYQDGKMFLTNITNLTEDQASVIKKKYRVAKSGSFSSAYAVQFIAKACSWLPEGETQIVVCTPIEAPVPCVVFEKLHDNAVVVTPDEQEEITEPGEIVFPEETSVEDAVVTETDEDPTSWLS